MNIAELPRVGHPVEYLSHEGDYERWEYLGHVMGFGTSNGEPVVIVNLETSEYVESRKFFITNLVVHLSSIRPVQVDR